MAQVQMNVSLTSELAELIQNKISSGMYNNASEVVRDALRRLDEESQWRMLRDVLLPRIASAKNGEHTEYNMDNIISESDDEDR